jgi:hypothetical protein
MGAMGLVFPLFDGMAQGGGVVTNAEITSDDGDEGGRVAQYFRGREMNGVQSADWFQGKGAGGAAQDRWARIDALAAASPSSIAATKALDSM